MFNFLGYLLLRGSSSLWIKLLWMRNSQLALGCWAAHVSWPPCTTLQRKRVRFMLKVISLNNRVMLNALLKCCFILPEVGSLKFHRYSEEKTMNWLKKKVFWSTNSAILYEIKTSSGAVLYCSFNKVEKYQKRFMLMGNTFLFLYSEVENTCCCRWRGQFLPLGREISLWGKESNPQHTSEWSQSQTAVRVSRFIFSV